MEHEQTCPSCFRPKSSASAGLVTQFINVCRCDQKESFAPETEPLQQCKSCRKPIRPARSGTLTQWIFSSDYCRCELPAVDESNETFSTKKSGPAFDLEEDDGVELPINKEAFPLDRYQPKMRLGSGASGAVYLSRDRLLGKKVAVKILHQFDGKQLIAFQDEAKITSRLHHPNIISILDFGPTDSGTPYMVLEYLENAETLESYLQRVGPLDIELAIRMFKPVCFALAHAHRENVYHRDLKPSNILLSLSANELSVKLIDFGVAKVKFDTQEETSEQAKTLAGTPFYIPPEVADGTGFTARSEIYSLGCVMFEALTGVPPFSGQTALETIAMHATHERPTLAQAAGHEFSQEIEKLIAKCLQRDPQKRFSSAREVELALDELLEFKPTITSEVPTVQTSNERKTALLAPLVVLLLVLGGFYFASKNTLEEVKEPKGAAKPKKQKDNTNIYQVYDAEKMTKELFEVDPVNKAWIARVPIAEVDLLNVIKYHRGDIKNLQLHADESVENLITPKGWSAVATLNLRILGLRGSSIRDSDVAKFAKIPQLRKCDFSKTKITDAAIKSLANSEIEELNLESCEKLTEACADSLARMKYLTQLNLNNTNLGNVALKKIAPLNLLGLRVGNCPVSDEGIANLASTKTLTSLHVPSTQLTRKGFSSLRDLDIRELNVDSCKHFDDACLETVVNNFPNLKYLMLNNTSVSPSGIKHLAKLKNLRVLHVALRKLNDDDLAPILNSLNLELIDVSQSDITDNTLSKLAKMSNLRKVQVTGCNCVTKEAVTELKKQGMAIEQMTMIETTPMSQETIESMFGGVVDE